MSLNRSIPQYLYHKSSVINRESILCGGLKPQVGTSYFCHWNCKKGLKPLVFLYDKEIIEYDTTYDDDIYQIDTLQLDKRGFELDPDEGMIGCFTYDAEIPCSFCKIIYKGTGEEL